MAKKDDGCMSCCCSSGVLVFVGLMALVMFIMVAGDHYGAFSLPRNPNGPMAKAQPRITDVEVEQMRRLGITIHKLPGQGQGYSGGSSLSDMSSEDLEAARKSYEDLRTNRPDVFESLGKPTFEQLRSQWEQHNSRGSQLNSRGLQLDVARPILHGIAKGMQNIKDSDTPILRHERYLESRRKRHDILLRSGQLDK